MKRILRTKPVSRKSTTNFLWRVNVSGTIDRLLPVAYFKLATSYCDRR